MGITVGGCIVGPDLAVLHLVLVKKGAEDIPGAGRVRVRPRSGKKSARAEASLTTRSPAALAQRGPPTFESYSAWRRRSRLPVSCVCRTLHYLEPAGRRQAVRGPP